ncbi:40218_t:CDS:2 [Gigaspora margarita]|uniref:40218_t:CDS:1 n=1 Tax=Gigaspora margarita TaxID=4874 RepID=A0ABN7UX51_GIGMA|nr:40218_t:CDS:2 [Gigaspora margarita]
MSQNFIFAFILLGVLQFLLIFRLKKETLDLNNFSPDVNDSRTFIPSTEIGGQFNMTNTVWPLPKGHKLYLSVEMFEKDESHASVGCATFKFKE